MTVPRIGLMILAAVFIGWPSQGYGETLGESARVLAGDINDLRTARDKEAVRTRIADKADDLARVIAAGTADDYALHEIAFAISGMPNAHAPAPVSKLAVALVDKFAANLDKADALRSACRLMINFRLSDEKYLAVTDAVSRKAPKDSEFEDMLIDLLGIYRSANKYTDQFAREATSGLPAAWKRSSSIAHIQVGEAVRRLIFERVLIDAKDLGGEQIDRSGYGNWLAHIHNFQDSYVMLNGIQDELAKAINEIDKPKGGAEFGRLQVLGLFATGERKQVLAEKVRHWVMADINVGPLRAQFPMALLACYLAEFRLSSEDALKLRATLIDPGTWVNTVPEDAVVRTALASLHARFADGGRAVFHEIGGNKSPYWLRVDKAKLLPGYAFVYLEGWSDRGVPDDNLLKASGRYSYDTAIVCGWPQWAGLGPIMERLLASLDPKQNKYVYENLARERSALIHLRGYPGVGNWLKRSEFFALPAVDQARLLFYLGNSPVEAMRVLSDAVSTRGGAGQASIDLLPLCLLIDPNHKVIKEFSERCQEAPDGRLVTWLMSVVAGSPEAFPAAEYRSILMRSDADALIDIIAHLGADGKPYVEKLRDPGVIALIADQKSLYRALRLLGAIDRVEMGGTENGSP